MGTVSLPKRLVRMSEVLCVEHLACGQPTAEAQQILASISEGHRGVNSGARTRVQRS